MSYQRIKIPRTADRKIAETFVKLGNKYGVTVAHVSALAFSSIGEVPLSGKPTGEWKALIDYDSCLIDSMSLNVGGLSITYARGGQYEPEKKSAVFDEIVLYWNSQGSLTNTQKLDVVSYLNKTLCAFEPERTVNGGISEEQSQLLAIHNSTLERLEALNEDLIRQSSEFRKRLENDFQDKIRQAETEYTDKKQKLLQDGELLKSQIEAREKSLEEKLKAIDDRDNTHVRREIRDRMLEDVKQRINQFGVSEATQRKRTPVFFGIVSLIAVFVVLLGWTGYEISAMDKQYFSMLEALRNISTWISSVGLDKAKAVGINPDTIAKASATDVDRTYIYWLWARFTLFSFGLIGTILYYIKWQNRWAEQHIASEFQLQQFYIDVNRANWVIESCLEWRKETDSVIPKTLIGSITNGLFINNQSEPEKVIHPADELASALMGSASKLKLKIGDNEVDFDKPKNIPKKPVKIASATQKP